MFLTILCILSFCSLATSFLKVYGIIISAILIIISLISFYRLWKIDYKRKTLAVSLIVCIISFVNSCIFSSASYFMDKKINIVKSLDNVKIAKVLQEYSSLENIIKYYILRNQAQGKKIDIFMDKVTDISVSKNDIAKYPQEFSKFIATNDSKNMYYYINYDKLNANFYVTTKKMWIVDKNGKLYLNAEYL